MYNIQYNLSNLGVVAVINICIDCFKPKQPRSLDALAEADILLHECPRFQAVVADGAADVGLAECVGKGAFSFFGSEILANMTPLLPPVSMPRVILNHPSHLFH